MGDEFFNRTEVHYEDDSEGFVLKERNYDCQYASIYAARLQQERKFLEETAKSKWGDDIPLRKLSELDGIDKCVIIGTLFKQMVYKPNILKEISEENHLEPQPIREKYTDSSDSLILEDELQRILLTGKVDVTFGVTGVPVAVLGMEDASSGKFVVEDMSYKAMPAQDPMPEVDEERYVVLISGMEVGGGEGQEDIDSHLFQLQTFVDVINGSIGDSDFQKKMSKVCRVIVVGNSLSLRVINKDVITNSRVRRQQSSLQVKEDEKDSRESIKNLDDLLFQLAINCDVDVMPGPYDPTTYALPQKALHPCLFPRSGPLSSFHLVPNPYRCNISGFKILGTSGQPIRDVTRITEYENHLQVLEKTLMYGHIAPTAPDTLGCYPFPQGDPFTIESCPHIYFCGNSPSFEWKTFIGEGGQKVLLATVPIFRKSKTAVLIDLKNMQCSAINVGI